MRALLCVGVAYFLIGVLVPVAMLGYQGELHGFTMKGSLAATLGGTLGAAGAVCIIFAFKIGRPADLCDAAGLWRRAAGECAFFDVAASAENVAESVALLRILFGSNRRRIGFVLQTFVVSGNLNRQ